MSIPSVMDLSIDEVMNIIRSRYDVEVESVTIGDRILKVLQIKDMEEQILDKLEKSITGDTLIKHPGELTDEVLLQLMEMRWWTKIWEPSFVLALFMGKMPPVKGQRVLEIGAGMGIVGVYAALCGHEVTISDISEDALLFARAHTIMNGCPHVPVVAIDWRLPYTDRPFEVIIGSEVVYDRRTYDILVNFLDQALAPGGTIFLAKNRDLKTPLFFEKMVGLFKFKQKIIKLSGGDGLMEVELYAIKRKDE
ncbi:MAG: protein N-lysine methyltransferase family protein [Syntrophobacterales bacterium]|nr:protein N-lysine methyltransferase family protein [Syntrophobacterales bacterium]